MLRLWDMDRVRTFVWVAGTNLLVDDAIMAEMNGCPICKKEFKSPHLEDSLLTWRGMIL